MSQMVTNSISAKARDIQVLIVDEQPSIRAAMRSLLETETDLRVCAEAENARTAWSALKHHLSHLILMDLMLGPDDGLDLVRQIEESCYAQPILVFSMQSERAHALQALEAGANGYLMKSEASEWLIPAIRSVAGGGLFLSNQMREDLHEMQEGRPGELLPEACRRLSPDEARIFRLLGHGLGNNQMTLLMNISNLQLTSSLFAINRKLNIPDLGVLRKMARESVSG